MKTEKQSVGQVGNGGLICFGPFFLLRTNTKDE